MKTMTRWMALATVLLLALPALAADPPGLMNYQGVLRDDNDVPLDGTYDMIFRFFDDADPADPENEIFVDEHLAAGTGAVTVTGGLFDVVLGSGNFYDGTGPGDHPHVYYVFGLHETVYLEVQVGVETLQPRMQVVSAPYAIHAAVLGGYAPDQFINTGAEQQEKTGLLRALGGVDLGNGSDDDLTAFDAATLTGGPAVYADILHNHSSVGNADTVDSKHAWEFATAVHGHSGSDITGPVAEATNADTLDSYDSTYFLNASETAQSKVGPLTINTDGIPGFPALEAVGEDIGGSFSSINGTGVANVAFGDRGIEASGTQAGGYFKASDASGEAHVGYGDGGILASGSLYGGYFEDTESASGNPAWAMVAGNDWGIQAFGNLGGGFFRDNTPGEMAYARVGYGTVGIEAYGDTSGGYFEDSNGSGYAFVGYLDEGISAHGDVQGGYFEDNDGTSNAHIAYGDRGIEAYGQGAGGYFADSDGSGNAFVGTADTGIYTGGDLAGGHFHNEYGAATRALTYVAYREPLFETSYGIAAMGEDVGGHFFTSSGSGSANLGIGDRGIRATGDYSGGLFESSSGNAWAEIAHQESGTGYLYGIKAGGAWAGGRFYDSDGGSGDAYLGFADLGVIGYGDEAGGQFWDTNSSGYATVGVGASKIFGNGELNFVQNHPYDRSKVVIYTAPEGDEVATYTRGTGRLENGEARVALGETFAWVTNPDIGLTAHVTPRGEDPFPITVSSVSTEELVVRGPAGSDAAFDFLVYGLRIGFEEKAVVRTKERESYIPSMADYRAVYEQQPELRSFSALERFKQMHAAMSGTPVEEIDTSAARALREAIHEYDPATDPPVHELFGFDVEQHPGSTAPPTHSSSSSPSVEAGRPEALVEPVRTPTVFGATIEDRGEKPGDETDPAQLFAVREAVEGGDLLALDPERPGGLVRAAVGQDTGVVGIAAGDAVSVDGEFRVELTETNYAVLKVDAGYGEIGPGDLLTSSFTPGHAMRAIEILPGTIVGKALEPLETGTGSIRVLVMPR